MGGKTYFISDLHLGASYFKDPLENERKVVRFLDSIKSDARCIYLLGDILDYWYEYKTVVPRGFTRFFGKIAELSDAGIEIHWFIGNHDIWIFDYLPHELGVQVHDGTMLTEIDGKRFFMSHGDNVGKLERSFRFLRALFRNRFCQKLYAAIHPRWTVGFAHNWSSHSRKTGEENPEYKGEKNEPLVCFAKEYLTHEHVDFFVFGHRHILLDLMIAKESRIIILGDWIHHFSYAVYEDGKMLLEIFEDKN